MDQGEKSTAINSICSKSKNAGIKVSSKNIYKSKARANVLWAIKHENFLRRNFKEQYEEKFLKK